MAGGASFGKLPYDALYGHWLNLDRQQARHTEGMAHAFAIALGATPDESVLRAMARNDREAAELAAEARGRKRLAEAEARHGF